MSYNKLQNLLKIARIFTKSSSCFPMPLLFQIVGSYFAIDKLQLSLLALFDVSAAFDMVDHQILLERLETSCGILSLPLLWIKSYLSDHTQMIVSGSWVPIFLGVPHGSVLGPLLFILYTADIPTLFSKYSATGHLLLTTFRHMFMVLLLVNFFLPAKLNYSQMILTLGCHKIDSL